MRRATRFEEAIARFDAVHAEDPTMEEIGDTAFPRELLYARRMTARLIQFAPDASEALRLAARCQHIRRWTLPRSQFSMDRTGYKQWRATAARLHAETAATILRDIGYEEDTIGRVQDLLRKQRLKRDAEVQTLEDVACLVFLEHYFADFVVQHNEEKLLRILRKTWVKMSPQGHAAALALDLPLPLRALVERAVAG